MADHSLHTHRTRASREALRVVAAYAAVGVGWLLLWDLFALAFVPQERVLPFPRTPLCWLFVALSAILLFVLVRHRIGRLARREAHGRARHLVLREMLDVDTRPTVFVDVKGVIVMGNRAAGLALDTEPDSLPGQSLYGLVPAAGAERLRGCIERVAKERDPGAAYTDLGFGDGPVRARAIGAGEDGVAGVLLVGIDPDESRRTKAAVESTRSDIKATVEGVGLGLWELDLDLGHVKLDPCAAAMLGVDADQRTSDFMTWREMVHPEDRAVVDQRMAAYLQGETEAYQAECRVNLPSGKERWLLTQARIIAWKPDGTPARLLGSFLDITDRRQAEERLRESEARFRRLVENARDVVYRLRLKPTRVFDYIGPAVSELTGYDAEELCGDPERAFRTVHPRDRARLDAFLRNPRAHSTPRSIRLVRSDGAIVWTEQQIVRVLDDTGECVAIEGIVRDVTERKRAEEEASKHQEQLIQTDKLASLGILVSGVAHEINNPNFVISSSARSLSHFWDHIEPIVRDHQQNHPDIRTGGLTLAEVCAYVPDLLKALNNSSGRIKDIVQELRDFVRQNPAGHVDMVNVNSVVQSSVTLLRNMIEKSTDRFIVQYAQDIPEVLGNYRRIEQVVINLIQNACQALPDTARAIEVTTAYEHDSDTVVITVRDEGNGAPKANLARLVEPFFTTKRDSGGTGLGLSICATIVQEHHGELDLDSALGEGMTASVRLPRTK